MNDDDLMTAVRRPFTGIEMTAPVEQITRRGHTIRARRRLPGLAATGAAAAAAGVLVVTALPQAGNQAGSRHHLGSTQLAAWTVTEHADGTINVTLRELRDAARLQATLRADGVPASVTFGGEPNPSAANTPADGAWTTAGSTKATGTPLSSASTPPPCPTAPESGCPAGWTSNTRAPMASTS
jgi:hypothetical protein